MKLSSNHLYFFFFIAVMALMDRSLAATIAVSDDQTCLSGKVFTDCGNPCNERCPGDALDVCSQKCHVGCFCPDGQVFLNDVCVSKEDNCHVAVPDCPTGQTYSLCEECNGPVCNVDCEPGCY